MPRITIPKFATICLISYTLPAVTALSPGIAAVETIGLHSRDTLICTISGTTACNKGGLPGNFCCPSGTSCYEFNSASSTVCCPAGKDCSTISTIDCDMQQQNATAHPQSQLFSTDLSGSLPTCGDKCCPKGMTCSNSMCSLSTASPSSAAPSSTQASTSSASSISTKSASAPSSTISKAPSSAPTNAYSTQAPVPSAQCNQFPASGVLVGFFSGLALGIILTVLMICCFGQRRHKRDHDELSSVQATVSDPIYHPQNGYRTDFLRRESKSKQDRTSRMRSFFQRTPTMRSRASRIGGGGNGRSQPKTPTQQVTPEMKREPSMESIKIYSPPDGGLHRPGTTFTDMMQDAGFRPGEPYLGSPGRVDPRSRGVLEV